MDANKFLDVIRRKNKNNCKYLLGPKYFLPQEKLINLKKKNNKKKIFTFTFYNGGAGDFSIYKKIIEGVLNFNLKDIKINLILGTLSKNKHLKKSFSKNHSVKVIQNPKNIYKHYSETNFTQLLHVHIYIY